MAPEKENFFHCLISGGGEPIELPMNRHFFIGRSPGNDIMIEDSRSSRRHCEFYWDGAHVILMDLDSSNGTLVNDTAITTCALNDGDNISVGAQLYTYRCVQNKADLSGTFREAKKRTRQMATQLLPSFENQVPKDNNFNGTLATMGIADLCQFLSFSTRTGLLLVKASKGRALVYFDAGEAIQAEYANDQGEAALLSLLKETKGNFSFKVDQKGIEKNITTPLTTLLLEAARRQDEANA